LTDDKEDPPLPISTFSKGHFHLGKGMSSMSPEEQRVIVHSFIECATITKMTARAAQLETLFRATKMAAAFVDWLAEKEAAHHNNYQASFEAGASDPLMKFLAKRDQAPKAIGDLASGIHIPIEMIYDWGKLSSWIAIGARTHSQ
jgi:hypothetical protein